MMSLLAVVFMVTCFSGTLAAPADDLIVDLPGLPGPITSNHYSGYLNATDGKFLHYWFAESQRDPTNDPLLLWLNGGPGCSSIIGSLTELGPYRINENGINLIENDYSWNKVANVIFLESPACVGYSYDINDSCENSDDEAALGNYLALQHFFEKFPEYQDRAFYMTGESYAGVYIPTLAVRILNGLEDFPINFQGYAIGNGILSNKFNSDSLMFWARYHALLDDELWDDMISHCCDGGIQSQNTCDFSATPVTNCSNAVVLANRNIYFTGMDAYNIYAYCNKTDVSGSRRFHDFMQQSQYLGEPRDGPFDDLACTDPETIGMIKYMNLPEVREALHIPSILSDWSDCWDFNITLTYNQTYVHVRPEMVQMTESVPNGMVFNGDVDSICNFLGNQWEVRNLSLPIAEPNRPWYVDGQIAGFVKQYENLKFVTIRGAGHMVHTDKPAEALYMIKSLMEGSEIGPVDQNLEMVQDEPNWAKACKDEDDLKAVINELTNNFAIASRASSGSRKEVQTSPRSTVRSCLTQVILGASKDLSKGDTQLHRLLSAKRHYINELTSDISLLQQRVKELEESNRTIQRVNKRQESALQKVYNEETKLPHILQAHCMEVKVLKEKIRKYAAVIQKDTEKLKDYDRKLLRLQNHNRNLSSLSNKKKLPERDHLTKELNKIQLKYNDSQQEIQGLRKKYDLMQKSLSRRIQREVEKHKSLAKEFQYLHLEHQKVLEKLKDRDKELASLQQYRGRARSVSSRVYSSNNESTSGISISSYTRHSSTSPHKRNGCTPRKNQLKESGNNVDLDSTQSNRNRCSLEGEITLCLESFTKKNLKFGRRMSTTSRMNTNSSQDRLSKHSIESSDNSTLKGSFSEGDSTNATIISSPENSENTVEGVTSLSAYTTDGSIKNETASSQDNEYPKTSMKFPQHQKEFCVDRELSYDGYLSSPDSFSPKEQPTSASSSYSTDYYMRKSSALSDPSNLRPCVLLSDRS